MGVDVPNIDIIIKIGCPLSLEELVQEFGRGGRDGRLAKGMYMTTCIYILSCFNSCTQTLNKHKSDYAYVCSIGKHISDHY